ncbi:MAG: DNA/RNA nuclease SfsA [Candidatus Heimdallarchaeota archaeon]|nr:MAG: DNA/RNA nuclease SfsA [Candidatus Heimdallarchaeota archaeon]
MKCDGIYYIAKFKERPNRFLAKVEISFSQQSKMVVEAHVPDPGRLKDLFLLNAKVILRKSSNQSRKTQYSLVGVKTGKVWVNIDSLLTNRLFEEEYLNITRFQRYKIIRPEFTYRNSRFDFLMVNRDTHQKALIEVKSVTLVKNGIALFPDAPTIRGTKHVMDLIKATKEYQSFLVFLIKRNDVSAFRPNEEIDPTFSQTLITSMKSGLQVCAVKCLYDPIVKKELKILNEIPMTQ